MGIMSKKLDDNELDSVSGGAGSNNGMVEADGVVVGLASNGVFPVKTDDGRTVAVRLSGLLRMNFIKIIFFSQCDGHVTRPVGESPTAGIYRQA